MVVANGAEGEPLSSKDAVLLQRAPHLVIDGLLVVGRLLGTNTLTIYAAAPQLSLVARALDERGDAAAIRLVGAPDTFLSGEASAVVNALSGRRPLPFDHRTPLAQGSPGRVPTVVQNVETLAQIALVARFGGDWFGRIGTADEPGSRLFTLSGDVPRPGVVEAAGGSPSPRLSPDPEWMRHECGRCSSVVTTEPGSPDRPSTGRSPRTRSNPSVRRPEPGC